MTIAPPQLVALTEDVVSLAKKHLDQAVASERDRCLKIVDLGCLGPPCCELGKSHARHCPQTMVAKIRQSGDL